MYHTHSGLLKIFLFCSIPLFLCLKTGKYNSFGIIGNSAKYCNFMSSLDKFRGNIINLELFGKIVLADNQYSHD